MGNYTSSLRDTVSEYDWYTDVFNRNTGILSHYEGKIKDAQTTVNRYSSRSGGKTPGYRAILKAGGVLPDQYLGFEKYEYAIENWAILERFTITSSGWTREKNISVKANLYVPSVPANPFSDSELNSRLIKKAKGSEWSAPVFFGELGETAAMVTKGATRLANMVMCLRKGNLKGFFNLFHPSAKQPRERAFRRAKRKFDKNFGRDPASAVSGAWLEYQYGWKPFCKDVDDAFRTLNDLLDKSKFKTGRVTTRLQKTLTEVINSPDRLMHLGGVMCGGIATTIWELSGNAVWRFSIKELNALGKLGLTNPLSAAWNLATLSFVVDWFIPIGDYLEALDTSMRFSHVGGTYGFKATGTTRITNLRPQGGWSLSGQDLDEVKRVLVTRRPMTGIPSLKLADLSFSASLGIQQATSAVALFSQAVSGLGRKRA